MKINNSRDTEKEGWPGIKSFLGEKVWKREKREMRTKHDSQMFIMHLL